MTIKLSKKVKKQMVQSGDGWLELVTVLTDLLRRV